MKIGDVEVLTLKQAAERIGVSVSTLRMQAERGTLDAILMGRTWVVTLPEIERYERENKGRPGRKPTAPKDA
jgi:excisionase family DNA binding protein